MSRFNLSHWAIRHPQLIAFLILVIAAAGALPIIVDGDTIGAIGVGGAPGGDKDEACAAEGLAKIKDRLK